MIDKETSTQVPRKKEGQTNITNMTYKRWKKIDRKTDRHEEKGKFKWWKFEAVDWTKLKN